MTDEEKNVQSFEIAIAALDIGIIPPCKAELFVERLTSMKPKDARVVKRRFRKILRKLKQETGANHMSPSFLRAYLNRYLLQKYSENHPKEKAR